MGKMLNSNRITNFYEGAMKVGGAHGIDRSDQETRMPARKALIEDYRRAIA